MYITRKESSKKGVWTPPKSFCSDIIWEVADYF
jgi:hypothetical protein